MNAAQRTFSPWRMGFLTLALSLPAAAQVAGTREPELSVLARAGRATLARLEKQAVSWSATTQLPDNTQAIVNVVATPTQRRVVLSIEAQGQRTEMLRIIMRDGVWYAAEGTRSGKYRPYEAAFDLPTAYFFLVRSDLRCIVEAKGVELGVYEGTKKGIATYRTPLARSLQQQLQNMISESEALQRRDPGQAARPDLAQAVEQMRELLQKGIPLKVEIASGMIVQWGTADLQTKLHGFSWLHENEVAPEQFAVGGTPWQDFTRDPTEGDTSELLMIGHSGIWRPGMKATDTDGRLLDLRTGHYRRIPFRGVTSIPGCFLQGRRHVVISGVDAKEGVLGLYVVDLRTGENRRLGTNLFTGGHTLMPALAPDGKTLAVLHRGPSGRVVVTSGRVLEFQACLVDVKSGVARALGKPRDMAFLSWLPGGKALLFLDREVTDPDDLTSPRTDTIARMDLDGRITKIREGSSPVLLNDGKTILFEDRKSGNWQTCDLHGENVKPYAGGLAEYGFPSPAPDGRRILMIHFRPGEAPEPTLFSIGENNGKPAIRAPGLWTTPAWR
jgi:hypothetical protein